MYIVYEYWEILMQIEGSLGHYMNNDDLVNTDIIDEALF